jgi:predicted RNA-binding protein with TRAM domain
VLYVARERGKKNWTPYSSDIRRLSIYPSIRGHDEKHLKVGDVVVVNVYDIDDKGNGVVNYSGFRIVIPNATSGSRVRVKIVKIQGNVAIGHIVGVLSESSAEY